MVPPSFYFAADKYEERLEGYPFSRRLRVLYHKPKNATQMGFAQFSIETNNQAPLLPGNLTNNPTGRIRPRETVGNSIFQRPTK